MQKLLVDAETGEQFYIDLTEEEEAEHATLAVIESKRQIARDAVQSKMDRLTELRVKGRTNLTASEWAEAQGLMFDLGVSG